MELPFYHKMRHEGYFRHLVVRRAESSGDILVNIVTTSQVEADLYQTSRYIIRITIEWKDHWDSSYNKRQPCRCGTGRQNRYFIWTGLFL